MENKSEKKSGKATQCEKKKVFGEMIDIIYSLFSCLAVSAAGILIGPRLKYTTSENPMTQNPKDKFF